MRRAGIRKTAVELVGEEQFDAGYIKRIRELKPSWTAVVVKMALSKRVTELPGFFHIPTLDIMEYLESVERGEMPERTTLWMIVPSNLIPSLAPEGMQLIIAATPMPMREGTDWSKWADRVYETLVGLLPDIPEYTVWKETITPTHLQDWADEEGVLIEAAQVVGQTGKDRPSMVSPIEGLYYVGADVGGRTVGVDMAAGSALRLADVLSSGGAGQGMK